jgi:hypothetical protein
MLRASSFSSSVSTFSQWLWLNSVLSFIIRLLIFMNGIPPQHFDFPTQIISTKIDKSHGKRLKSSGKLTISVKLKPKLQL